ncbi:hypothetical protein ABBQ38_008825 [Trebouxia sp. C0009 RCD-2024]
MSRHRVAQARMQVQTHHTHVCQAGYGATALIAGFPTSIFATNVLLRGSQERPQLHAHNPESDQTNQHNPTETNP